MHCIDPNCFDDSCQGECQEENKASQDDKEQEPTYCED